MQKYWYQLAAMNNKQGRYCPKKPYWSSSTYTVCAFSSDFLC